MRIKQKDIAKHYGKHIRTVEQYFAERGGYTMKNLFKAIGYWEIRERSKKVKKP